jgi:hypothetical protein
MEFAFAQFPPAGRAKKVLDNSRKYGIIELWIEHALYLSKIRPFSRKPEAGSRKPEAF